MSHMRVGNSPIYYIAGQEPQLEKFSNYLKSKEKEAFLLLQEKKFLRDSEQPPAIRVALREIKDFAFPFRRNNETLWRYLTVKESEFKYDIKPIEQHQYVEAKPRVYNQKERELGEKIVKDINIEDIEKIRKEKEELEKKKEVEKEEQKEIEDKVEEEIEEKQKISEEKEEKKDTAKEKKKEKTSKEEKQKTKEKSKPQKSSKKKAVQKQDDKFFDKIKEFLSKETIEILNVESFNKNEIHLRIKADGEEKLLVAHNKKRVAETDIINANKKASQLNLKYVILSMGEPTKKLSNLIEAAQNLDKIEKIEK
jgi:hypothetical protein